MQPTAQQHALTQLLFGNLLRGQRFVRRHVDMRDRVSAAEQQVHELRGCTCCLNAARACALMWAESDAAEFSAAARGECGKEGHLCWGRQRGTGGVHDEGQSRASRKKER